MTEMNDVIFFYIFYIMKIKYKFINTVTVKYNIKDIINEININYNLKSVVETVAEPSYIKFLINFAKVSIIYVKLLFKLKPNEMKGQLVKEFRIDNEPILMPLRKQNDDILITDLIQQCFTYYIHKSNSV